MSLVRWIGKAAGWIAAIIAGFFVARQVTRGRVEGRGDYWVPVLSDDSKIAVTSNDGSDDVVIDLPGKLTYKDVKAVQVSGGTAKIEVKHGTTDRRGDPDRGRDSDMGL